MLWLLMGEGIDQNSEPFRVPASASKPTAKQVEGELNTLPLLHPRQTLQAGPLHLGASPEWLRMGQEGWHMFSSSGHEKHSSKFIHPHCI